ncbi:hypothetical protein Nepgr_018591 [Nepenthes gracilis]|uniref:Uncharacterized protein n=1 Tax=Nepenthes gracilis TaxID=150966 RepID=A0AAD3STK7_NEPGR|nr:hypothetical protein Nepgr_018591 [Nepenthes gracilis]
MKLVRVKRLVARNTRQLAVANWAHEHAAQFTMIRYSGEGVAADAAVVKLAVVQLPLGWLGEVVTMGEEGEGGGDGSILMEIEVASAHW